MHSLKKQFIEFAMQADILRFGSFTLKSGRQSPYFFNAGLFNTGQRLAKLGDFYAATIQESPLDYDMLFGPAYKGIPLVASTAIAFANEFDIDKPYAFNRKEAKAHGEGGHIVGSPLAGKVLIIDDVITAGTAIRESIGLIEQANATFAGVVISLDRQERGKSSLSAIQEIEDTYQVPVIRIITLQDIIDYLEDAGGDHSLIESIHAYKKEYGISDTVE